MKKYMLLIKPITCSESYSFWDIYVEFKTAIEIINRMLASEGRHPLPADLKEQPLLLSLGVGVVELLVCETKPLEEINKIDTDPYVPFGDAWKKELRKLTKDQVIEMASKIGKQKK